jgi:hypothetical protein
MGNWQTYDLEAEAWGASFLLGGPHAPLKLTDFLSHCVEAAVIPQLGLESLSFMRKVTELQVL